MPAWTCLNIWDICNMLRLSKLQFTRHLSLIKFTHVVSFKVFIKSYFNEFYFKILVALHRLLTAFKTSLSTWVKIAYRGELKISFNFRFDGFLTTKKILTNLFLLIFMLIMKAWSIKCVFVKNTCNPQKNVLFCLNLSVAFPLNYYPFILWFFSIKERLTRGERRWKWLHILAIRLILLRYGNFPY